MPASTSVSPCTRTPRHAVLGGDIGFIGFELVFHGRPAHAAADPWNGANALDGLILTYSNINALRQHVRPDVRIHGIITDGGEVPNIIPVRAAGRFMVRSRDPQVLEDVYAGCRTAPAPPPWQPAPRWRSFISPPCTTRGINGTINRLFMQNFAEMGEPIDPAAFVMGGSTDFGNVCRLFRRRSSWPAHTQPAFPGTRPR